MSFSLASPILLLTLVGRSALTSSQGSGTGTTCTSIWLVETASVRMHGRSCPSTMTRLSFAIPDVDCTVEVGGLVFLRPEMRGFPGFHLQRWVSTQFSRRHRTAILLASYSQEQLLFFFARSYWPMTSSANMSLSWTIPIWLKSSLRSINTSSKLRKRTSWTTVSALIL